MTVSPAVGDGAVTEEGMLEGSDEEAATAALLKAETINKRVALLLNVGNEHNERKDGGS